MKTTKTTWDNSDNFIKARFAWKLNKLKQNYSRECVNLKLI